MKNNIGHEAPVNLAFPPTAYFVSTSKIRGWFLWAATAGFLAGWVMGSMGGSPAAVNRETKWGKAPPMALGPPLVAPR